MELNTKALLNSHVCPTEGQLVGYRAILEITRAKIVKIRQELAQELELEHSYELLVSPMRRIPDDILQEIFLHCLPEKLKQCLPSVRMAPVLICLVCKRRRDVATATASWNRIFIEGPPNGQWPLDSSQREVHIRWFDPWSHRSCQAPLDVYLDLGCVLASQDT